MGSKPLIMSKFAAMQPPKITDVSIESMMDNPYPVFEKMRKQAPVVWLESARINLVIGFDEIQLVERNADIFASTNPVSLMNRVMGHSLMRKDGQEHRIERQALEGTFSPAVVKQHWAPIFRSISDQLIGEMLAKGNEADLFADYAVPMASLSLLEIIGFKTVSWQDLADWSQLLMDGVGNYALDEDVFARAKVVSDSIDEAIDAVIDNLRDNPDPSAISSMLHAPSPLTLEQIRANVKVIVGGGLNEPRDSILTVMYGLLANPEQKEAVMNDPALCKIAFEEAVRWISPIGMYPRRVTRDTLLGGVELKEGDQLGVCVGAANRGIAAIEDPSEFNILRGKPRVPHLAFGAGPHFCAGTWVARMMVGEIAIPDLLAKLTNLRLTDKEDVIIKGWVFRGPTCLPVSWD